jgi:hypothetical protein
MPSYLVFLIAAAISAITSAVVVWLMRAPSNAEALAELAARLDECEHKLAKPPVVRKPAASPSTSELKAVQEHYHQLNAETVGQGKEIAALRKDCATLRLELATFKKEAAAKAVESPPPPVASIQEPAVIQAIPQPTPPAPPPALSLVDEFERADQSTNRNVDRMRAYFQRSLGESLVKFEESEGVALFHFRDGVRAVPFRNTRLAERWQRSFDVSGGYNRPIERVLSPALFEQQEDGGLRLLQKGSIAND